MYEIVMYRIKVERIGISKNNLDEGRVLSGEESGPDNGVDKGWEKIADPDPGYIHQVDADPQDDEAARCGHRIQNCRLAQKVEVRGEQSDSTLDHQNG